MTARPRLAVVGCGYWGSKHVRVIHEAASAQLALTVDSRVERLQYIQALYPGVEIAQDFQAALDADIDGVVLATPIASHYSLARQALLAGKHVLVEKPLATSSVECWELIELAQRQDRVLMVGHTFEYHPAVEYLRKLVGNGELGQIYYIDCARLNLGLFQRDANVLWDLAPHDLSIIHYILDQAPLAVSAWGSEHALPEIADVAFMNLQFEGGVSAHVHVSWLDPCKVRRVTVVGSKAMVVFNDVAVGEKVRIYDKRFTYAPTGDRYSDYQSGYHYGNVIIPHISGAEPLAMELEDFASGIAQGREVRSNGYSGLRVVEALEAASQSLDNRGRVESVRVQAQEDSYGLATSLAS
ncbi:MAG: Gfo/Idh/MocA family oxidoreductase [Chloroflexota bacterium]|nr:Gfo/Idh/MocA family oxidoreductase [Chloroflexota bacterium]